MPEPAVRRLVVGAIITGDDGRVLAAQRSYPEQFAGLWEFPGAKVEPGESPEAALSREVWEELGCRIEIGDELTRDGGAWPVNERLELRVYHARLVTPPTAGHAHHTVAWFPAAELPTLAWLPADTAIARLLADTAV
ncbi:(deoxy)nucleoside triphosphate pyrophosphohydrolase [Luteococcus sp. H138]|uniref:(deoxy)nucleoside triphosphate pyrophosphohydrolase n=1 Tax=unclassified Luteococcus TaxID=2639923 RepID=UPI00313D0962